MEAPGSPALTYQAQTLSYGDLAQSIENFAGRLIELGIGRGERVGIYLEKRPEFVVAAFGTMHAGAVFVPLNPLLKAEQVAYILRDCNVRVLVTSVERLAALAPVLAQCHDLRHVVLTGHGGGDATIPQSVVPVGSVAGRGRGAEPSGDRRRHGRDSLHVGQHRAAQGRGAVTPEHGDRRQERRLVPRESCFRHAACRACRCRSMLASAS